MSIQVGFTNKLKTELLQSRFTCLDGDNPPSLYVGLFLSTDQPDSEPVELVVGNKGYARQLVKFSTPINDMIQNSEPISFGAAFEDWTLGTNAITHIGIFDNDGLTPPNDIINDPLNGLLVYLPLSQAEQVPEGATFVLNTGSIKLQLV